MQENGTQEVSPKFFIGIDIGSKDFSIAILKNKHLVQEIKTDYKNLISVAKGIKEAFPTHKAVIFMESTGDYFLYPGVLFENLGYKVFVVPPFFVKEFSDTISNPLRGKKTGEYDAKVIAIYGIERGIFDYRKYYLLYFCFLLFGQEIFKISTRC